MPMPMEGRKNVIGQTLVGRQSLKKPQVNFNGNDNEPVPKPNAQRLHPHRFT